MKIILRLPGINIMILLIFNIMQVSAQAVETNVDKATEGIQTVSPLPWPPKLPNGRAVVTDQSTDFLIKPQHVILDKDVEIATTAPTIDFLYFPGQTHPGKL